MPGDSPRVARMLFDFNTEYEIETPPVDVLEPRVRGMLAAGWSRVLIAEVTSEAAGAIAGPGAPAGLGLVNFRRTVWSEGPAARALYESAGFTNIENDKSHGQMLYYELEL